MSTDCIIVDRVDGVMIIDGWVPSLVCNVVSRKLLFSGVPIALGVLFLHHVEG